jgi:tetratricopeptide (TPR) repeat protein
MARGAFARADSMVATDSSVDGLALRGRLALVRGDLKGARAALREAGPFAGTQADATERSALLALLQPIDADSLPALGAAFLSLARRDTAGAVERFAAVAVQLPPAEGGAELLVYAGRLEAAQGQSASAETLFRKAVNKDSPGAAAAAELELGRLYIALARPKDAIAVLEDLVLTYSASPLVPQARRLLDVARGAVPET